MPPPSLTPGGSSSHKRTYSAAAELPIAKKPNRATTPAVADVPAPTSATQPQWIYLLTWETEDPYLSPGSGIVAAYANVQDANSKAKALQLDADADVDDEEWGEKYDSYGCATFSFVDAEGGSSVHKVERMEVMRPGSEQDPKSSGERSTSQDDDDDDEDDEDNGVDGEADDGHEEIKQEQREARRQGRKGTNCHGQGCGGPLCESCWPQTDQDWIDFAG